MKKIITISILVVIAIIGGLLIWSFSKDAPAVEEVVSDTNSPFGLPIGSEFTPTTDSSGLPIERVATSIVFNNSKLRQLTSIPVAGANFYGTSTQKVRFVERATGHIVEMDLTTNETIKVSNITIPRVYEAFITNTGDAILRTANESQIIESYFIKTSNPISQKLFPYNALSMVLSPDKSKVAFITSADNGFRIMTSNGDGTSATEVYRSPLKDWVLNWYNTNNISLTTKAHSETLGSAYRLNINSKTLTPVVTEKTGLTTLFESDSRLLLSENSPNYSLNVANINSGQSSKISPSTVTEKCIWLKRSASSLLCFSSNKILSNDYLEKWYQGRSFEADETLWIHDTTNDTSGVVIDFSQIEAKLSAHKLVLSSDEKILLFLNKIDSSLWLIEVENFLAF